MSEDLNPDSPWPPWVQLWVLPFLEESGLWPVLFALLGHVVVILAPLLLAIGRGQTLASVPLAALIFLSGLICKTEIQAIGPSVVTGAVVITWLMSVGLAYVAAATGVF